MADARERVAEKQNPLVVGRVLIPEDDMRADMDVAAMNGRLENAGDPNDVNALRAGDSVYLAHALP
jgi:hypothetical protein